MIGRTIAHYAILEKLGEGGMGVVYKARDQHLDRIVALKVLAADKMADPERSRRFVWEAKAASALNHPNIVSIYDVNEADGVYFIAMECVEGDTLDKLIGRHGMPVRRALGLAAQLADGLGKAHAARIVHRDLKPSNIIVTPDGVVKILDFGLAKLARSDADLYESSLTRAPGHSQVTETGLILGTVAYMSPEQAEGKPVDARSDIFSFGSVFYEMLTGRRPFSGDTGTSTLAAVIAKDPEAPSGVEGALPPNVERAVMRCLAKDPQRRWQNMSDLKVTLRDLLEDSDPRHQPAQAPVLPTVATRRWRWVVPAGMVCLIAGATAVWWPFGRAAGPIASDAERITFESRVAYWPAISPDGQLIAYASDREGNFDVYVRQLAGRQAIRVTHHDAPDWFPCFSPDGSRLIFRSERDGGGLYAVESLGGVERKIADGGRLPAFSPDGTTIVYLVAAALVRTARIFLVPADGGAPRPFQPDFQVLPSGASYSSPLWSVDGTHILFDGMRAGARETRGWWLAPVTGGEAVRIEAPPRESGPVRLNVAWWHDDVYYSEGSTIGGMTLYRVPLPRGARRLTGDPEVVTSSAGIQYGASISNDGRMVFSTMAPSIDVQSAPLRPADGMVSGPPEPLTSDAMGKIDVAAAGDGSRVAWLTYTLKQAEIRIRKTESGQETSIPLNPLNFAGMPRLNRDGSRLTYSDIADGNWVSYVHETATGNTRAVCVGCDVRGVFSETPEFLALSALHLVRQDAGGTSSRLVLDVTGQGRLVEAALAPSERWVAFTLARPDGTAALLLANAAQPTPAATWTLIDEAHTYLGSPSWSSDGRTLYYGSTRDGFVCTWALRVSADGRPEGEPFAAMHHHTMPSMLIYGASRISAGGNRLYMLLSDFKGDLWSLTLRR